MEMIKAEVVMLENDGTEIREAHLQELNEVQLALVGGGIGTVIFG